MDSELRALLVKLKRLAERDDKDDFLTADERQAVIDVIVRLMPDEEGGNEEAKPQPV